MKIGQAMTIKVAMADAIGVSVVSGEKKGQYGRNGMKPHTEIGENAPLLTP